MTTFLGLELEHCTSCAVEVGDKGGCMIVVAELLTDMYENKKEGRKGKTDERTGRKKGRKEKGRKKSEKGQDNKKVEYIYIYVRKKDLYTLHHKAKRKKDGNGGRTDVSKGAPSLHWGDRARAIAFLKKQGLT